MAEQLDHSTDDKARRVQINDDLDRLKKELHDLKLTLGLQLEAIDLKLRDLEDAVNNEAPTMS